MARAHLSEPAPRVSSFSEVPADLDELVDDCLRKEPNMRQQSARELVERLDALAVSTAWSQDAASAWWFDCRKQNAG
jgi:serine/threonine-protein kinase